MILPKPQDAVYRGQLFRLLIEIVDNKVLSNSLVFKGGTCATMLGYLDRFSVDLDFDILPGADAIEIKIELSKIFVQLGFIIKDQSTREIQYKLGYKALENQRNTLKLDVVGSVSEDDTTEVKLLPDIQRYMRCQTIETMFAHKLIAFKDRYNKHQRVAGRDIYDIYHFFINGYSYNPKIIEARTGKSSNQYMVELLELMETIVTDEIITQDLNPLLSSETFNQVRKSLRVEVISILNDEIQRT